MNEHQRLVLKRSKTEFREKKTIVFSFQQIRSLKFRIQGNNLKKAYRKGSFTGRK